MSEIRRDTSSKDGHNVFQRLVGRLSYSSSPEGKLESAASGLLSAVETRTGELKPGEEKTIAESGSPNDKVVDFGKHAIATVKRIGKKGGLRVTMVESGREYTAGYSAAPAIQTGGALAMLDGWSGTRRDSINSVGQNRKTVTIVDIPKNQMPNVKVYVTDLASAYRYDPTTRDLTWGNVGPRVDGAKPTKLELNVASKTDFVSRVVSFIRDNPVDVQDKK